MTRIAQLTDLHLVEDGHWARTGLHAVRLRYLSFGRPIDAADRRDRARRALVRARALGADHVVVTGDLTEDGTQAQFEAVAEVLADGPFAPDEVTLVAGNHDAYDDLLGFERALEGPLAPWRRTSGAGAFTVLDDVVIVPVSTRIPQAFTRSAGAVGADALGRVSSLARRSMCQSRALVVAQHHPPHARPVGPHNWIDGTMSSRAIEATYAPHPHLSVLHGHVHARWSRRIGGHTHARSFSADAVVESERPLRLYDVDERALHPAAAT